MTETVITVNSHQPTNAQPSSAGGNRIRINVEYFTTIPGIIKIVQFVLGILCMALASPARTGATSFFLFVVIIAFIATILWSAAYFLGIREGFSMPFNWILTELINTGIETLLYLIAFIVQIARWSDMRSGTIGRGSNITGGVFGMFNFLVYAAGTYLLYMEHRRGSTQ